MSAISAKRMSCYLCDLPRMQWAMILDFSGKKMLIFTCCACKRHNIFNVVPVFVILLKIKQFRALKIVLIVFF